MKLSEFVEIANKLMESPMCQDPEVVVVLSQPGMLGTPCARVKEIALGFDWDHGKFMLRTAEPVIRKPKEKGQK